MSYARQHLIDPELCLRCGGCEAACQQQAIHFDAESYNYAVDPDLCSNGHECLAVCTTGAIRTWRMVPAGRTYTLREQFAWERLPEHIEPNG